MALDLGQHRLPTKSSFPLTPTGHTRSKSATARDPSLELRRIVGTTCNTITCFALHPESRSFAYPAGAVSVIATIAHDDDGELHVTQQFYKTNVFTPFSTDATRSSNITSNCLSPSHADSRTTRTSFRRIARETSPLAPCSPSTMGSPGTKSTSPADRVKAATAVALSPNGKWLAVGESGYKPRVLLFPRTATIGTSSPQAVIAEHAFGVHAVAFSPDSTLLATLGTINDGFLRIWNVDPRTGALSLLASNKCTNVVRHMAWMGRSLICVGVRFVKVWRPDEPAVSTTANIDSPGQIGGRPLLGRNTLLGDLLEATFSAVVPISADTAVLCTESGAVCILDDRDGQQYLSKFRDTGFAITSAGLGPRGKVLVAGVDDRIELVDVPTSLPEPPVQTSRSRPSSPVKGPMLPAASIEGGIVGVGCLAGSIIMLDHDHTIRLLPITGDALDNTCRTLPLIALPAHSSPILGIRALRSTNDAKFVTWSASGEVTGWSIDGQIEFECQAPLYHTEDGEQDQLTMIACFDDTSALIVTGDKHGVLSIMDMQNGKCINTVRAHGAQITDIAVHCSPSQSTKIATGGRDRTVQVFAWNSGKLRLLQTLTEHVGAVTGLVFSASGEYLVSCSADRTVVIRRRSEEQQQFEILKTVTLKATPLAMSLTDNALLVSTADRLVNLVDLVTGSITSSFKTLDGAGESIALTKFVAISATEDDFQSLGSSLTSAESPKVLIAGISSTDKSIRVYDEDDNLLAQNWGHSEGVTDVAYLAEDKSLVTVASDGTIFIWNFDPAAAATGPKNASHAFELDTASESPLSRPPLRKVTSLSAVASRATKSQYGISNIRLEDAAPRRSPRLAKQSSPSRLDVDAARKRPALNTRRSTTELSRRTITRGSPSPSPSPCPVSPCRKTVLPTVVASTGSPEFKARDPLKKVAQSAKTNTPAASQPGRCLSRKSNPSLQEMMGSLSLESLGRSNDVDIDKNAVGGAPNDQSVDICVDVPLSDAEAVDPVPPTARYRTRSTKASGLYHVPTAVPLPDPKSDIAHDGAQESQEQAKLGQELLRNLRDFRSFLKDPTLTFDHSGSTARHDVDTTCDKENGPDIMESKQRPTNAGSKRHDKILLRYVEMELERTLEAVRTGLRE